MRKKIVQSQDAKFPFQALAPVVRSFKMMEDGEWKNLSYDEEFINYLVSNAGKSLELLENRNILQDRRIRDFYGKSTDTRF